MSWGSTQMLAGEIYGGPLFGCASCFDTVPECSESTCYPSFRFFKQYLLMLAINQMAASLFRFIGGAARNMIVANVCASFMLLIFMVLGGFVLARGKYSPF